MNSIRSISVFAGTPARCFSTSHAAWFPRKPAPRVTPQSPTSAQLAAPPTPAQSFSKPIYRRSLPPHIRFQRPPTPQRHITDTDTALPLPTTYPPGITSPADFVRPRIPSTKLTPAEAPFPYRYYEISLRRSLNGLPAQTKEYAHALGLFKRHQVVWRKVGPRSAGQILRLRELVAVRLVNDIPEKVEMPAGYAKVGSAIGNM